MAAARAAARTSSWSPGCANGVPMASGQANKELKGTSAGKPAIGVPQALAGLKVACFGGYAAGPHIGKVLANFGARVVHVESKDHPDGFRLEYPPFAGNRPGIN